MDPDSKKRGFFNYPEPLKGPDAPYRDDRKSNPVLRGPLLVICVYIMEWFGFIREMVWHNAGFSSLRRIQLQIQDYEPFFEPSIVPLPEADGHVPETTEDAKQLPLDLTLPQALTAAAAATGERFPASRYYSAADYHAMYLSGEMTPTAVAKTLLPLIRRSAPRGAHAAAWFDTKEDLVLQAAAASTLRYQKKQPLGPLDGVPTAVKDEYDMEGYLSCLGSLNDYTGDCLEDGSMASWCVRKLQEAGCVLLGKLHMVEFGLDTPGDNIHYGTPPNPYNDHYFTGGSSSGAGYAVAAGLVPFALGSDGGGSVRIPASFCSVYGLKPTHGRISFKPGQNHCVTCACLGPLAADVPTLATVYAVMAQPHPTSLFPAVASPAQLLDPAAPNPRTLGICQAWFDQAAPAVRELCATFVDALVRDHGYRTVRIDIPFLVEGQTAHALTVLSDAATLLPAYGNLAPTTRLLLALGRTTPSTDYVLAQKLRRVLVQHLSHLWHQHPGMLLVTPTTRCAGWPMHRPGERGYGMSDGDTTMRTMEYVWMANFCGLPSLTVPAGYVVPEGRPDAGNIAAADVPGKVPVGIMATGEWASEALLLRYGLDAEAVSAARRARPPTWVDVLGSAKPSLQE